MSHSLIGAPISEIDTPALLIDLEIMEHNIDLMSQYFATVNADLRPHYKTHKTPIIAHKQLEAGAIGVTCAKLGEATTLVEAGIKNVLIANQVVGTPKIERLISLANHSDIIVAVDNPKNVAALSKAASEKGVTLNVLVEVNVGNNRCGVGPKGPALSLTREVLRSKGLNFRGLMGYEGFCVGIKEYEKRKTITEQAITLLVETKHELEGVGIDVEIVSGGATGTYNITGEFPEVTEVEAGSYVVMDTMYKKIQGIHDFGYAMTLLTTVISHPTSSRALTDAGIKSIAHEFGMPAVKELEGIKVTRLAEEHTWLELEGGATREIEVGNKIELIPSHCCTTTNLHDWFYAVRNGRIEAIWNIAARGKFQ
ncbi:MAG: DSD1 family PLP-dependent enzyme [Candidatus Heimdallarchaeota archaeon]